MSDPEWLKARAESEKKRTDRGADHEFDPAPTLSRNCVRRRPGREQHSGEDHRDAHGVEAGKGFPEEQDREHGAERGQQVHREAGGIRADHARRRDSSR
jgi:hypothetical protein